MSFEVDATEQEIEGLVSKLSPALKEQASWQIGRVFEAPVVTVYEVTSSGAEPYTEN